MLNFNIEKRYFLFFLIRKYGTDLLRQVNYTENFQNPTVTNTEETSNVGESSGVERPNINQDEVEE